MFRRPADLTPSDLPVPHCTPVPDFLATEPLIELCAGGRLYEVETWIAEGRPIQCIPHHPVSHFVYYDLATGVSTMSPQAHIRSIAPQRAFPQ